MASRQAEEEEEEVPDWMLAQQGIKMLINNSPDEAKELFRRRPNSLPMFAGHSFAIFMEALMTFEDDKLQTATSVLKEVERRCSLETGWFKSMKRVLSGNNVQQHSLAESLETQIILADSQVCTALITFLHQDVSGYIKGGWVLRKAWKVYQSVYNEIRQLYMDMVGEDVAQDTDTPVEADFPVSPCSSSEDTGRRDSSVSQVATIHSNGYNPGTALPHSQSTLLTPQPSAGEPPTTPAGGGVGGPLKKSQSANSALSRRCQHRRTDWSAISLAAAYLTSSTLHLFSAGAATVATVEKRRLSQQKEQQRQRQIDAATVKRLMGAVSFGYGLLQLGISLLPPSLLKLTNFLGFGGNRQSGIACLMYAKRGVDMRAPLATLSLLWYHTIVRPFYALDGSNVQAGVSVALGLLQESDAEYGSSALFLFFKGRCYRLNSDIPTALTAFQTSVEVAAQREVRLLALHEVGWCYIIQLDFCAAEDIFAYLKTWSRWSRAFYAYLAGVCGGACGLAGSVIGRAARAEARAESKADAEAAAATPTTSTSRGNQLEEFLARRVYRRPTRRDDQDEDADDVVELFWKLLVYELLYLWNSMPSCSTECIKTIIKDCEEVDDGQEPMLGLSKLIMGSCYCIQRQYSEGINKFRICLSLRKHLPHNAVDAHVSAFAQYELGALLIKWEETREEGKMLLQTMSQYKDYDFEQRLNVRVHSLLKHL